MAGNNSSVLETEGVSLPSPTCNEGPVLNMMSKRLRALKKKYNRILQIEDNKAQGKSINKEQEEVLRSKTAVAALIDEYEKLRKPLATAVQEEISEREKELLAAASRREHEHKDEGGSTIAASDSKESEDQDLSVQETSVGAEHVEPQEDPNDEIRPEMDSMVFDASNQIFSGSDESQIEDLLTLIYFAQLFDVRSHSETSPLVWTKVHERSSCLSYDCVTEDSPSPLSENDLDDLSLIGLLMTSRLPNATLSHKDSLKQCVKHAKLWLQNSDAFIREDIGITYSHLRERLNRILSSDYFTMTPELKIVCQPEAVTASAAIGQYPPEIIIPEASNVMELKSPPTYFSPQAGSPELILQSEEHYNLQTMPVDIESAAAQAIVQLPETGDEDHIQKEPMSNDRQTYSDGGTHSDDFQQSEEISQQGGEELQDQPEPHVSIGPRGYQGSKVGGRGYSYGNGGRGRGSNNGRGRRGGSGRGGYGNGRGGPYYEQGSYNSRGYYGRGGGRGGRGGNVAYNGYGNGQAPRSAVTGSG